MLKMLVLLAAVNVAAGSLLAVPLVWTLNLIPGFGQWAAGEIGTSVMMGVGGVLFLSLMHPSYLLAERVADRKGWY